MRGQVVELHALAPRQRHGTFHQPLQLAHVARPGVHAQGVFRREREREVARAAVALEEVASELRDVAPALPERRHVNLDAAQT